MLVPRQSKMTCPHRSSRFVSKLGPVVKLLTLLFVVTAASVGPVHAQEAIEESETYRVKTSGGNVVVGTVVSASDQDVVVDTRHLGTVTIQRDDIQSIEQVDPDAVRDGEYWFANPQSTRYFFAPNAIGIPRGEGYYQNAWIFFNNANYGVSDHLSIGAGTVPIFLFGAPAVPIWVLPKVSIPTPTENVHLAGGAVLGGIVGEGGGVGGGLLYASSTVGNRDHNATIGLGYGYADGDISSTPAINVSGMTRVSRTLYLISENYFLPGVDGGNLISAGVRWAPENFAVDFALFRPLSLESDSFIGFPWLGLTIPFGE